MATNDLACPIWGDEYVASGVYHPQNRTFEIANSPRAGGGYIVDQVLLNSSVVPMPVDEKARLTTWLIDQRMQGVRLPKITEAVINYVKTRAPLATHERAERLLRLIANRTETVGTKFGVRDNLEVYAWSESTRRVEVGFFIDYLTKEHWLDTGLSRRITDFGGYLIPAYVRVTVKGRSRIASQFISVDSSQAFVAMWFDESMTDALDNGFELAIMDAGYKPFRIDRKEHINKIDDEIIAEIRRSRFLVADFTHGKDGARGGVYYEAGFARGLGLPVIFACREDVLDTLHFDTNHYNHIVWTDPVDLRGKLKNRILAVIGQGPAVLHGR